VNNYFKAKILKKLNKNLKNHKIKYLKIECTKLDFKCQ